MNDTFWSSFVAANYPTQDARPVSTIWISRVNLRKEELSTDDLYIVDKFKEGRTQCRRSAYRRQIQERKNLVEAIWTSPTNSKREEISRDDLVSRTNLRKENENLSVDDLYIVDKFKTGRRRI